MTKYPPSKQYKFPLSEHNINYHEYQNNNIQQAGAQTEISNLCYLLIVVRNISMEKQQ